MLSQNQLDALMEKIMNSLGDTGGSTSMICGNSGESGDGDAQDGSVCPISLTPSAILVLAGILGGVLNVNSILIDNSRQVQILLTGSLKRKTEIDKMLDAVGCKTFDEVVGAIVDRFA
ncbi:hypothetical protein [Desulfoscipio sp. XC116]|uniref:hypothetical protein n=1 Tax=Desulfoscipio sp. XC116 TaxID=3144975 RepID=UPI00325ACA2A